MKILLSNKFYYSRGGDVYIHAQLRAAVKAAWA